MTYSTYQAQSGIPANERLILDMTRNIPNGVYYGMIHTDFWCDAPTVVENAKLPDEDPIGTPNPKKFFKGV